jgi:hypothetical protein
MQVASSFAVPKWGIRRIRHSRIMVVAVLTGVAAAALWASSAFGAIPPAPCPLNADCPIAFPSSPVFGNAHNRQSGLAASVKAKLYHLNTPNRASASLTVVVNRQEGHKWVRIFRKRAALKSQAAQPRKQLTASTPSGYTLGASSYYRWRITASYCTVDNGCYVPVAYEGYFRT